jgi:hypothetical protein
MRVSKMLEPKVAKDAERDDLILICLHKDSAILDFLARGAFDQADVELFREMVILQDELRSEIGPSAQLLAMRPGRSQTALDQYLEKEAEP